jgi:hypothetical protein
MEKYRTEVTTTAGLSFITLTDLASLKQLVEEWMDGMGLTIRIDKVFVDD